MIRHFRATIKRARPASARQKCYFSKALKPRTSADSGTVSGGGFQWLHDCCSMKTPSQIRQSPDDVRQASRVGAFTGVLLFWAIVFVPVYMALGSMACANVLLLGAVVGGQRPRRREVVDK